MSKDIASKIEKLREEIRHHDYLYYGLSQPEISDKEYDDLMRQLKELEERHSEFKSDTSPTARIGGGILEGFKSARHRQKMLSLDNTWGADQKTRPATKGEKPLPRGATTCMKWITPK